MINSKMEGRVEWYFCKLHPDLVNINLSSIEHHCKYKESEFHKSEILRLLLLIEDEDYTPRPISLGSIKDS
jgi:hypothetical protein